MVGKFSSLPIEELNRLAWTATQCSPEPLERQLIYQLRLTFKVDFTRRGGSQMFHPEDNNQGGTGTLPILFDFSRCCLRFSHAQIGGAIAVGPDKGD